MEIQLFSVALAADVVKMYIRLAANWKFWRGGHLLGDQILPGDCKGSMDVVDSKTIDRDEYAITMMDTALARMG